MDNILILWFKEKNMEIANLKAADGGYVFASEMFVDDGVGANILRRQLMNLALRKSGMQSSPQGKELNDFVASVDSCRRELTEYDSEVVLPGGRVIEIEQYEYENAVLVQTTRITEDVKKAIVANNDLKKVIVIADDTDVPLLRSVFLRNFATVIGKGRSEAEWLLINDKVTAEKAFAEAKERPDRNQSGTVDGAEYKESSQATDSATSASIHDAEPRGTSEPSSGAQTVEGAYTGQQTDRTSTTKSTQKPKSDRRQRVAKTSSTNSSNASYSQLLQNGSKSILIVFGGIFVAIVLGFIIVTIMAISKNRSNDYVSYDISDNTEISCETEGKTSEKVAEESYDSASSAEESTQEASSSSTKGSYDYVYSESGGLRKVEKNGKKGFIDANGNEVVPPVYDYIYSESDGLYKVEKDGKKGFINKEGKVVIPVKYDYIYSKSDGMYKVEIGNKKGFLRADGTVFIEVKYDYIYSKSDGMYKVELNDKKGFVDASTGKEICAPVFDYIYSFSGGLAKVEKDGKTGYINRQGKLVQAME